MAEGKREVGLPDVSPGDRARRLIRFLPCSIWSCLTVLAVIVAVAWPLHALRSPIISYDGWACL